MREARQSIKHQDGSSRCTYRTFESIKVSYMAQFLIPADSCQPLPMTQVSPAGGAPLRWAHISILVPRLGLVPGLRLRFRVVVDTMPATARFMDRLQGS